MTAVSDAVVIGVVLGLIFAAVSYYLFTRMSQLERKVSLMENILLDLKVTTEQTLLSATEPSHHEVNPTPSDLNSYRDIVQQTVHESSEQVEEASNDMQIRPFEGGEEPSSSSQEVDARELFVESAPRARTPQQPVQVERDPTSSVTVNYEAMTYKELTQYAKQKGISGLRNMSKKEVIDVLRRREGGEPASTTDVSDLSSWKNHTVSFGDGELQPLNNDDQGLGSAEESFGSAAQLDDTVVVESSLVE